MQLTKPDPFSHGIIEQQKSMAIFWTKSSSATKIIFTSMGSLPDSIAAFEAKKIHEWLLRKKMHIPWISWHFGRFDEKSFFGLIIVLRARGRRTFELSLSRLSILELWLEETSTTLALLFQDKINKLDLEALAVRRIWLDFYRRFNGGNSFFSRQDFWCNSEVSFLLKRRAENAG